MGSGSCWRSRSACGSADRDCGWHGDGRWQQPCRAPSPWASSPWNGHGPASREAGSRSSRESRPRPDDGHRLPFRRPRPALRGRRTSERRGQGRCRASVPVETVAYRAQTNACAMYMPLKEGTEGLGIHRPRKAQCLCHPAVPPASQTVPGIILRNQSVPCIVSDRCGRRRQFRYARNHPASFA